MRLRLEAGSTGRTSFGHCSIHRSGFSAVVEKARGGSGSIELVQGSGGYLGFQLSGS